MGVWGCRHIVARDRLAYVGGATGVAIHPRCPGLSSLASLLLTLASDTAAKPLG
jgi:hypothetical protein